MPDNTWEGEKGRFWAANATWFRRLLAEFGDAVVEGAALQPGERVLDVGCGNGDVSVDVAAAVGPDGAVVGVDLSDDELDVARLLAAEHGLTNVSYVVADAAVAKDLGGPFDVLISRFGVMFFPDPVAAFAHLHTVMAPGGRAAFVCWKAMEHNDWLRRPREAVAEVLTLADPPTGGPGPSSFAEADHVRGVLTRAGWRDVGFTSVERPVHLGESPDVALGFLAQSEWARDALDAADDEQRAEALDRVRAVLVGAVGPDGRIVLPGAAWLVTARA